MKRNFLVYALVAAVIGFASLNPSFFIGLFEEIKEPGETVKPGDLMRLPNGKVGRVAPYTIETDDYRNHIINVYDKAAAVFVAKITLIDSKSAKFEPVKIWKASRVQVTGIFVFQGHDEPKSCTERFDGKDTYLIFLSDSLLRHKAFAPCDVFKDNPQIRKQFKIPGE